MSQQRSGTSAVLLCVGFVLKGDVAVSRVVTVPSALPRVTYRLPRFLNRGTHRAIIVADRKRVATHQQTEPTLARRLTHLFLSVVCLMLFLLCCSLPFCFTNFQFSWRPFWPSNKKSLTVPSSQNALTASCGAIEWNTFSHNIALFTKSFNDWNILD